MYYLREYRIMAIANDRGHAMRLFKQGFSDRVTRESFIPWLSADKNEKARIIET